MRVNWNTLEFMLVTKQTVADKIAARSITLAAIIKRHCILTFQFRLDHALDLSR